MIHYNHPSPTTVFLKAVFGSLKTAPSLLKMVAGALMVATGSLMTVAATAAPHSGHSRTTINTSLQHLAERMMRGKQGSIVAIDPATGAIKCMVSASPRGDSLQRAVSVA